MSKSKLLHLVVLLAVSTPLLAQEHLSHGRFKDVTLYRPEGEVKHVVLFLSGDNGWESPVTGMARKLVERGAMVAGIDTPQLFEALEADGASCVYPDGDLENLSHYLQGYARLPTYHTPVLAGYSAGATMAYAMMAQAPDGTFAGALYAGILRRDGSGEAPVPRRRRALHAARGRPRRWICCRRRNLPWTG